MKRMAIDVGGTFTDCLVLSDDGEIREFKSATVPADPSMGLLNAASKAARAYGQTLDRFLGNVEVLIHGTTLATNALINETGAKTGMLTTRNFRDFIEIRRGFRDPQVSMYNVFIPPYEPLVPRSLRLGVAERTLYTGEVMLPVVEEEVYQAADRLRGKGVESVAVCFLHSYANPDNEKRACESLKASLQNVYVTASHEVLPVWREYERFSTTVVSAYVGPIVERYLRTLERRLGEAGFRGMLLLMLSSGLVETVEPCISRAVYLISSGPAAAPAGALYLGQALDRANLLSIDMGGTSFDVCLIWQGEIPTTTEGWVGDERVAMKMVDVHSAGAGGGSLAWVDSLGLLRVGPRSAGAEPGPACYGKGGENPTVTDADLLLGYVPADFFLGGEMQLDAERAGEAVKKVARPLGMSVAEAAEAIFTTVNTVMADQIREVSTKRGYDVRDFTVVVGGGAGPVHAAFIAETLGISQVVIPAVSAAYSAFGMFAMDIGRNYARSYISRADSIDIERVQRLYQGMEDEALAAFRSMQVAAADVDFSRTAEMRYVGQFHEVEVQVVGGKVSREVLDETLQSFHRKHTELYTFSMPWKEVEFSTFRLRATVRRARFQLQPLAPATEDASPALKRYRSCRFNGSETNTRVYDGDKLRAKNRIEGPAIIEETTTTVVIPRSFVCEVDRAKNYILRRS